MWQVSPIGRPVVSEPSSHEYTRGLGYCLIQGRGFDPKRGAKLGAWSANTFGNDTACDWIWQVTESDDLSVVARALSDALAGGADDLDADLGSLGLGAAEVVARLRGRGSTPDAYTENLDDWVREHQALDTDALLPQARQVVDRVSIKDSELRDLWEESESFDDWMEVVSDLRRRLS